MNDPQTLLINLLTIGIPECIGITMLMTAALRLTFNWKTIMQVSISLAFSVLIIRLAIVKTITIPGIHTSIAVLTLALLVAHFYQIPKLRSLTTSVLVFFLLAIVEVGSYRLVETVSGLELEILAQNELYWTLINWLHIIALAGLAFFITRTNWYKRGQKLFQIP